LSSIVDCNVGELMTPIKQQPEILFVPFENDLKQSQGQLDVRSTFLEEKNYLDGKRIQNHLEIRRAD
jgi:hypothetical protein